MKVNIIHRPEPDPYRRKIFKMQQEMAHDLGMRTTILATAPSLEDDESIELMKMYRNEYHDEIGISFHTLNTGMVAEIAGYEEIALWLYDEENKRKVIRFLLEKFRSVFDFEPQSAGSYHFDSSSLRILLDECPSIKTVVAGCFEEGVRVYHGCNNSWYLFNEGMPWAAWYPSRTHSLRPAKNEKDALDVVAVPHLSRDMVLAYEGRNDFWASHPPNVQRGMGNKGENCPYDKNLIDQHRFQERFNNGYSYLNIFVSAQWLIRNHNSEEPPEVSVSLYKQQLEYVKSLELTGDVEISTMSEFGHWYRENVPFDHKEICLAKEILYGSGKHYIWYIDPRMRVLIDLFQGGSVGDLRPYVGEVPVSTGPDTTNGVFGTYPYLIQSQHRTGYLNHFTDGSRTTAILKHNEIEVDMADIALKCDKVFENQTGFMTKPYKVRFGDKVMATLKSVYRFTEKGEISIERSLISIEGSDIQEIEVKEKVKACHGKTEYAEDMKGIRLCINNDRNKSIEYAYKRKKLSDKEIKTLEAFVPQVNTIIGIKPEDGENWTGEIEEGILFNPYYTLQLTRHLTTGKSSKICLYLKTMK